MENYILEGCVDSVESAIEAEAGGANRLELCANLIIGGTTPSIELFKAVRQAVKIKINVLIRPRFGDFLYTKHEFEIIKNEVLVFKALGADGIVIGCLKADGSLDVDYMRELVKCAGNMSITLHRAFDVCKNPLEVLAQVKELGIHTILTSGQENSCIQGKVLIKTLIEKAGDEVAILIGGGVSAKVIEEMMSEMPATNFHMSGKVTQQSGMTYRKKNVSMGLKGLSEYELWCTDRKNILAAHNVILNKLKEKDAPCF